MAGFVECLESEEAEEGAEKVDGKGNPVAPVLMLFQSCNNNLCADVVKLTLLFSLNDQN